MISGFLFRFKILPYLQERILPKYLELLQKQNFVIVFTEEEEFYLKQFSLFILHIFGKYFDISKEMNIHSFLPLFEILEKFVNLLLPIMKKICVPEKEKVQILSLFDAHIQTFILPILS